MLWGLGWAKKRRVGVERLRRGGILNDQTEFLIGKMDDVAGPNLLLARKALAVDVGAIGGVEIAQDQPAIVAGDKLGMVARDANGIERERQILLTPDTTGKLVQAKASDELGVTDIAFQKPCLCHRDPRY